MKINGLIAVGFMFAYCFACNTRSANQQLAAYMKDPENQLLQYRQINDVSIKMQFIPPAMRLHQLNIRGVALQKSDSDAVYAFHDFQFELSKPLWKPDQQAMEHLQFKMADDLKLVLAAGDTVRSSICERMASGSSGEHVFLLSFPKSDSVQQDLQLIYDDKLLQTGVVKFTIPGEQIRKTTEKIIVE